MNKADLLQQFENEMNNEIQNFRLELIRKLMSVGERCINEARTRGSYKDHTGHLRSSVGYVIIENGEIIQLAGFEPVSGAKEGAEKGKNFARSLASNYPEGIALVLVAGMDYAEYVAAKGYDVLDSAGLLGESLVKKLGLI